MPRDTFNRAVLRMIDGQMGSTATVTNYVEKTDGSGNTVYDGHGDPERSEDSKTTGVPAVFRRPSNEPLIEETSQAGAGKTYDMVVWVKDENVSLHGADADRRFATRLTDESSGREFDVLLSHDERNGLSRARCREV